MKKILFSLLISGLFATPVLANPYVSGSVGSGSLADSDITLAGQPVVIKFKSGVPFSGAIGFKEDLYRVEAAIGYQSNDLDSVKFGASPVQASTGASVSIFSYLVNGYYDVDLKGSVAPYVTAGIGGASITMKSTAKPDQSKSGLAYQFGAGIGVKASENMVFDLGYRYFKTTSKDAEFHTNSSDTVLADVPVASHHFMAGVRYSF